MYQAQDRKSSCGSSRLFPRPERLAFYSEAADGNNVANSAPGAKRSRIWHAMICMNQQLLREAFACAYLKILTESLKTFVVSYHFGKAQHSVSREDLKPRLRLEIGESEIENYETKSFFNGRR